jgi:hypothetical protein
VRRKRLIESWSCYHETTGVQHLPRKSNPLPAYLLHKPTGQARVRIAGHDYYLGPFGSKESRRRYGELVARHSTGRLTG